MQKYRLVAGLLIKPIQVSAKYGVHFCDKESQL